MFIWLWVKRPNEPPFLNAKESLAKGSIKGSLLGVLFEAKQRHDPLEGGNSSLCTLKGVAKSTWDVPAPSKGCLLMDFIWFYVFFQKPPLMLISNIFEILSPKPKLAVFFNPQKTIRKSTRRHKRPLRSYAFWGPISIKGGRNSRHVPTAACRARAHTLALPGF